MLVALPGQGPGLHWSRSVLVKKEHLLPIVLCNCSPEGPSVQSGPPPDGFGNRTAAGQGALLETFRGPRIVVVLLLLLLLQ